MAVGTNTLGLLFKIGVDDKDYLAALKRMMAENEQFATGVKEGMAAEFRKAADELDGGIKKLGSTFDQSLTQFNQFRRSISEFAGGDAVEGVVNLTRSLGPLGLAIGAVAVAATSVGLAIKGAIDAAQEIGTTSKDDF